MFYDEKETNTLFDKGDAILGTMGIIMGFFTPSLFMTIATGTANSEFLQKYALNKLNFIERLERVINLNASISSFIIIIIIAVIILVALKKGASIIYTLGMGFIFGLTFRFMAMAVLGWDIPFVQSAGNETLANSTI